jgi:16S rRNA (cytosine1402-N4)-methyltransferase
MVNEINNNLITRKDGIYVDCTAGEGGHSKAIYNYTDGRSKVIAVDIDYEVLEIAEKRLEDLAEKIEFFKAPYQDIDLVLKGLGIDKVDGFLMDLGVSTFQLKGEGRGFTFMNDEPLDMRMDTESDLNAAKVVNEYDEKELARIIFEYGQEFKFSRRIAKSIVDKRPINTTFELIEAIKKALPYNEIKRRKRHLATKTFQALRTALDKFTEFLNPGGRVAILTFHSLEDKIVKHYYKNQKNYKLVTKKPLYPSEEEVEENPRSRSVKLRVAEYLG